eukprot:scaffold10253_cov124-Isochrysis_galbana.AAC.15
MATTKHMAYYEKPEAEARRQSSVFVKKLTSRVHVSFTRPRRKGTAPVASIQASHRLASARRVSSRLRHTRVGPQVLVYLIHVRLPPSKRLLELLEIEVLGESLALGCR